MITLADTPSRSKRKAWGTINKDRKRDRTNALHIIKEKIRGKHHDKHNGFKIVSYDLVDSFTKIQFYSKVI